MPFSQELHNWSGFYSLLAEVSASFAGLLFVALSLNADGFRDADNRHFLLLARQTFISLITLAAVALVALMPLFETSQPFGGLVMGTAFAGVFASWAAIKEERKIRIRMGSAKDVTRAFYVPALVYLFLLLPAYHLSNGLYQGVPEAACGQVSLLVVSARNAWLMLGLPRTTKSNREEP